MRSRVGLSLESESDRSTREGPSSRRGRTIGTPSRVNGLSGTTEGTRSRRCMSASLFGVPLRSKPSRGSTASRGGRAGRLTAPVGRVSGPPAFVVESAAGIEGLASLPLRIRVRRSSSSSGTPGVRVAAPVERSDDWTPVMRAGRPRGASPRSPVDVVVRSGALAGNSRSGAELSTCFATASVVR
jgi:hypothetical protein